MRCGTAAILILGIALAGCATNRGVIDLRVSKAAKSSTAVPVKFVAINDRRVFQLAPKKPSIPSLRNGEINDRKITSRAIARKRNTYGQALGDILLPEGRTVEQLTREALTKALNESGYEVLSKDDPGYETARPLTVEIDQFWAWVTPGFWEIAMEFEAKVRLVGDWPVAVGRRRVRGYARVTGMAGTTEMWTKVMNNDLAKFIEAVKTVLRRTSALQNFPGAKPVS